MRFLIRKYRSDDAAATLAAFRRSVVGLASHDYDPEQIRTWAGQAGDLRQWDERRSSADTWVAVPEGNANALAGFIDVDGNGYIDMLFVDPDYARCGAASALLARVARRAAEQGAGELSVHTSITARPFFERRGFRVVQVRHPMIEGMSFVNYLMIRP
ncbi:acetyltransferase, GNAT family [Bifidobacterium sp. DSM 109958]|uniref:Acetyltransferase, GNAT family n=1 Tax=Bifidobacterium moraviense TaxID=2675323 RepID=A0A7Y0F038_9BIFI|nr:GNAT family N-acetyltransferase [Bifidobacterium sp. DSM 109958]NMM99564.1 acetyltransferase, GNAT family [Bifidobacterium sp. DSM 109958]